MNQPNNTDTRQGSSFYRKPIDWNTFTHQRLMWKTDECYKIIASSTGGSTDPLTTPTPLESTLGPREKPALREQQCSLYLEVSPSSPLLSYVRMRTTVKHHPTDTLKRTIPYKDFCYLSKRNPAKLLCSVEELHKEPITTNREGSRVNATEFAWRDSGNPIRQNHLQFTQPGSNPDSFIFGSLDQHESSALDYAATEVGLWPIVTYRSGVTKEELY
uniref:Uncharacterized protein n=1 Tax=Timema shepardi TaxID=629360 RepID=A0A7R9FXD2_TIMSH|nr:unnamed protein product [Timema shepardi]